MNNKRQKIMNETEGEETEGEETEVEETEMEEDVEKKEKKEEKERGEEKKKEKKEREEEEKMMIYRQTTIFKHERSLPLRERFVKNLSGVFNLEMISDIQFSIDDSKELLKCGDFITKDMLEESKELRVRCFFDGGTRNHIFGLKENGQRGIFCFLPRNEFDQLMFFDLKSQKWDMISTHPNIPKFFNCFAQSKTGELIFSTISTLSKGVMTFIKLNEDSWELRPFNYASVVSREYPYHHQSSVGDFKAKYDGGFLFSYAHHIYQLDPVFRIKGKISPDTSRPACKIEPIVIGSHNSIVCWRRDYEKIKIIHENDRSSFLTFPVVSDELVGDDIVSIYQMKNQNLLIHSHFESDGIECFREWDLRKTTEACREIMSISNEIKTCFDNDENRLITIQNSPRLKISSHSVDELFNQNKSCE